MRKLQIGVMGSAADLKYNRELESMAEKIGQLIAESGAMLVFGAEKDYDSLSAAACRGAKSKNGLTIGITYNKGKKTFQEADVIISTGLDRGGGREFVLVLSCDAIIALSGGSGTLTEIAIAYQANIPLIVVEGSGGWADKLANTYLDERKRVKIISTNNAEEAVRKAIKLATININKDMLKEE